MFIHMYFPLYICLFMYISLHIYIFVVNILPSGVAFHIHFPLIYTFPLHMLFQVFVSLYICSCVYVPFKCIFPLHVCPYYMYIAVFSYSFIYVASINRSLRIYVSSRCMSSASLMWICLLCVYSLVWWLVLRLLK